jgi:hypothetical protein
MVDGPWRLTGYTGSGGTITFSANDSCFAGKPHLSKFEELPFTSDTAEYSALRAGLVDYGYVPTEDASIAIPGYKITPWVQWQCHSVPGHAGEVAIHGPQPPGVNTCPWSFSALSSSTCSASPLSAYPTARISCAVQFG